MVKFNSKAGHEIRTWFLFFVGIALALIFAANGNPLGPWWTLIIGAFTCSAVIVSAVQALSGGMSDAVKKDVGEARRPERNDHGGDSTQTPPSTLSIALGARYIGSLWPIRRSYPAAVQ